MFISFVLYGLIEAESMGTIKIDNKRFSQSLNTLASYIDKNQPYGLPQYVFWPQAW